MNTIGAIRCTSRGTLAVGSTCPLVQAIGAVGAVGVNTCRFLLEHIGKAFAWGLNFIELVELWVRESLAAENVALDPVRRNLGDLVAHVTASGNGKNVVEFLECALFRLWKPQEDHEEGKQVHACIEAKHANGMKGSEHTRQCKRQDRRPKVVGGNSPGHTNFTMGQWKDFGTVGEGHGAFTGAVKDIENVDEECNSSETVASSSRDVKTEPSSKKGPTHVGECEEQECTTTKGVNGPHGWPRKQKVDDTKAPRGQEGICNGSSSLGENGGRVESNNVDSAHLLGNHDNTRGLSSAANTWNGKQFTETSEEVAVR